MKTIKLLLLTSVLLIASGGALQAQFMKKVGEAAKRSAENAALRKTEEKTDDAVSSTIDKATNPDTYKDGDSGQEKAKTWTCPKCKTKGNTGKFCTNCGEKQPGATGTWTCAACGHVGNKGKFCTECGA